VRLSRIINTGTFRLTALYVFLFAISVAILGVIVYETTASALERRLESRIKGEMATLQADFNSGGLAQLAADVRAHQQKQPAGPLRYLLLDAQGERLAGSIPQMPARLGWSTVAEKESDGDLNSHRTLAAALSGGARLAIAASREETDEAEHTIFDAVLTAFGAVVVLGITIGIALSQTLLKRVETVRRTAEAIIAGDFTQRVPVRGTGDEFDRLSYTLNRMLDRITDLMDSLRQVSADIAHDLKTPLAHLRQRLETTQRQAQSVAEHNAAIDLAIAKADEILGIFSALLRIAQIEAGTRRADFRELDLSAIFANVVEAFAPAVADAGKHLDAKIKPDIRICGDRELLTQMLANLIENAIRHTPAGTRIEVSLGGDCSRIVGTVSDNGPGTPAQERERIFQRFYRLERSWSTPGSGLGLSLVKAVAELHDIGLEVRDAEPGFLIIMRFPEGRQSGAATTAHLLRVEGAATKDKELKDMKDALLAGVGKNAAPERKKMSRFIRRSALAIMAIAFSAALTVPALAAGTTIRVSLWGDMTGTMPTNMGMGMSKGKGASHGHNAHMGITIYRNSIPAGKVTFEVKNNAEHTIHEMLVVPIKNTTTPLPYLKNENRLDESKIHSLGEVSELDPGHSGKLTLNLKLGKYLLACNVPGHFAAGMWTVLTVRH
jgi:signal transduction histidine kinase/uncharacterized cupredoxin-like copper-binding protein